MNSEANWTLGLFGLWALGNNGQMKPISIWVGCSLNCCTCTNVVPPPPSHGLPGPRVRPNAELSLTHLEGMTALPSVDQRVSVSVQGDPMLPMLPRDGTCLPTQWLKWSAIAALTGVGCRCGAVLLGHATRRRNHAWLVAS